MSNSNFQDTFTKNENSDDLQYDEFAFYFFATTILTIIIIPYAIYIIKQISSRFKVNRKNKEICQCNFCKSKITLLKSRRKIDSGIIFKLIVLVFLAYLYQFSIR